MKIMLGDKIVSSDNGLMTYKIKIFEDVKIEGDPKFPCIDYKIKGEYANCVEKEMIRQNSKFLNCTPSWMTDNDTLWCKGKQKLDSNFNMPSYKYFLEEIKASVARKGKCLVPCKITRYDASEIGLMDEDEEETKGLSILFENDVDVIKSSWKIDETSIISKIGGFIGISKNFLWLLIMVFSSIGALFSRLK